jgi:hypothetical protein
MSEAGHHVLDKSQRSQVLLSDGRTAELRVMQRWDRHDVLSLFRRLPNRVRPMLPDTNDEAAIDRWISDLETAHLTAVIAASMTPLPAHSRSGLYMVATSGSRM